ncbi:unnamed protein product [Rhodiola kirilowii]
MTSMSLFQAKNILGFKMKRSIINFCKGEDSTSTLNQQQHYNTSVFDSSHSISSHNRSNIPVISEAPQLPKRKVTLEEMIMQLEVEEENARKEKLKDIIMQQPGRRSCVNNSDILRSARNALNQYPRFSLDGRDAMYRNFNHISPVKGRNNSESDKRMPSSLGGDRVVWCKPGVVARLMGLEAIPVPVLARRFCSKEKLRSMMKRQSLWQMAERRENEQRKKIVMDMVGCRPRRSVGLSNGSCSRNGEYCVINPVAVVQQSDANFQGVLPTRRYK